MSRSRVPCLKATSLGGCPRKNLSIHKCCSLFNRDRLYETPVSQSSGSCGVCGVRLRVRNKRRYWFQWNLEAVFLFSLFFFLRRGSLQLHITQLFLPRQRHPPHFPLCPVHIHRFLFQTIDGGGEAHFLFSGLPQYVFFFQGRLSIQCEFLSLRVPFFGLVAREPRGNATILGVSIPISHNQTGFCPIDAAGVLEQCAHLVSAPGQRPDQAI